MDDTDGLMEVCLKELILSKVSSFTSEFLCVRLAGREGRSLCSFGLQLKTTKKWWRWFSGLDLARHLFLTGWLLLKKNLVNNRQGGNFSA